MGSNVAIRKPSQAEIDLWDDSKFLATRDALNMVGGKSEINNRTVIVPDPHALAKAIFGPSSGQDAHWNETARHFLAAMIPTLLDGKGPPENQRRTRNGRDKRKPPRHAQKT